MWSCHRGPADQVYKTLESHVASLAIFSDHNADG